MSTALSGKDDENVTSQETCLFRMDKDLLPG